MERERKERVSAGVTNKREDATNNTPRQKDKDASTTYRGNFDIQQIWHTVFAVFNAPGALQIEIWLWYEIPLISAPSCLFFFCLKTSETILNSGQICNVKGKIKKTYASNILKINSN